MSLEKFSVEPIPIYYDVTADKFRESIQLKRRPAVLRGLDVGPCLEKWKSVHYLLDHIEDKPVKVN